MPNREYILAGMSLHTERPYLEKRFDDLSQITGDFGPETKLVGIAYDTRARHPVTNNPILWVAGDDNCQLTALDSRTMQVIESWPYPSPGIFGINAATKCFGLAVRNEPTTNIIAFLTEPGLDATGCPLLFHLRYVPGAATNSERLQILSWFYVNTTAASNLIRLHENHRGMTEYRGDFMILGRRNNKNTVFYIDQIGMPLASYDNAFQTTDDLRGLLHIHSRIYTTMDRTADPQIGGRTLVKFITDEIDRQQGQMIPLPSIEPFFLSTFFGDMTLYQDRMAACDHHKIYLYKMIYFTFLVDEIPNDDIEMGSILIGESKIKEVKIKNIADYYMLKDIVITKGTVVCPGAAQHCPASEALSWVKMSTVDPTTDNSPLIWQDSIVLANTPNLFIRPDGELRFWVRITVPVAYTNLEDAGGLARLVTVDDGPFAIPLEITAKVG